MEDLRERGRDLPKRYVNRPTIDPALEWFFEAFWRLSPDRTQLAGFDRIIYSGIPFTAIHTYAKRYRIEGYAFDCFIALIKALDGTFLEIRNSRDVSIRDEIEPDDSHYVKMLFGIMDIEAPEPSPLPLPPPETGPIDGTDLRDDPPPKNTGSRGRPGARKPAAKRARTGNGRRRKGVG